MVKRHLVVVKGPDGTASTHLMKEWLRRHPELLPLGTDPTHTTSHELRRMLTKSGWRMEEREDKVLLVMPDATGNASYADELIESVSTQHEELEEDVEEITFSLERDLQAALRANIEQLEPGLVISDSGTERVTDAGRIDITATDRNGSTVVIELKAGTAQPAIIAQVLAYMASVAEADHVRVRGIIVAGDFHRRVIQASPAIPNLALRQYAFQFNFRPVA